MKKFITFLLSLSVVAYWNGASTYAQSSGRSPVNQGHSQTGTQDHVKTSADKPDEYSKGHEANADWETKFNERFQNDAAFRSRIQSLLPKGTDLTTAESGFKNRGQFIAALHVCKNLNISFDQLKAKMTGVTATTAGQTNSTPMSLGK